MKKLGIAGIVFSIIGFLGCIFSAVNVYAASDIRQIKLTCFIFIFTVFIMTIINVLTISLRMCDYSINKNLTESIIKEQTIDATQSIDNICAAGSQSVVSKIPKYAILLLSGRNKKYPIEDIHFDTYQVTLKEKDKIFNTVLISDVIFDYDGMTDDEISAFINVINSKKE